MFSRRTALQASATGFGYLAFAGLAARAASPLAAKPAHFAAKAKRVIFLYMAGAPSHVDTFDPKPKLQASDGQSMPGGGRQAFSKLHASPFKFSKRGQSGLEVSDLFPNVAAHADSLCVLRGMHTDVPAHPQASIRLHTGTSQFVRPSLGAWTTYGLGTVNDNLPGFVSIAPPNNNGGSANYGNAFLPAVYQGTPIGGGGFGGGRFGGGTLSMSNLKNPKLSKESQREQLDFIQGLNRAQLERTPADAAVEGAIESFELAYRMQRELPALMDASTESKATQALYGIGDGDTDAFGRQCLLARRLAEAGVRFIEIGNGGWDHHRNLKESLNKSCHAVDKPIAGLLSDLKARGLLDSTLVLWGGEFGRTPYSQGADGRDHNHKGFTHWMAGGGVKGGYVHGATDEYGYEAVSGKLHVHDWHATILHLLGLDHEKLTFKHAGRDFRLTDVSGVVAKEVVA